MVKTLTKYILVHVVGELVKLKGNDQTIAYRIQMIKTPIWYQDNKIYKFSINKI